MLTMTYGWFGANSSVFMGENMKSVLKFMLGIAVLLVAFFVFFCTQRSNDLSTGNLENWLAASTDQRTTVAKVAVAGDGDINLIVACVNKMATLPGAREMIVRDAISLCHTGIILKENI